MAWKKDLLTGRLVDGRHTITVIPLAFGRAGILIFEMEALVVAPYDEGHGENPARYSVSVSSFVQLVPTVQVLSTAEALRFAKIFEAAVGDTERSCVQIDD